MSLPTPDAVYTNSKTTTGTTLSVTTGAHAVGKRVIVATVRGDASPNPGGVAVTDSRGNTYTRDAISLQSGTAEVAIFSCVLTTALQAGDTITATWNASQNRNLMAAHVYTDLTGGKDASTNNTVTSNPTDSGLGAATGNPTGSTTGASTNANGMTFAVVSSTNNAGSISAGSGFTALGPNMVTAAGSSDRRLFTEAKNTTATGVQSATATLGTSAAWAMAIAHYPGTVPPTNVPPTANAGSDQSVAAGATVTLTGSDSDSDGTISSRSWSQVGGSPTVTLSGSGNSRTFTAPSVPAGTVLTFRYSVTDNSGATTTDDMTVTVAANANPVANAGADQTNRVPGTKVTLHGTDSDVDGTVVSRSWSQISGTAVTLAGSGSDRTFDAPAGPATLVFRYTVTDDGGGTSTDDVSIGVIAAATLPDGLHEFVVNGDGTKSLMTHKVV